MADDILTAGEEVTVAGYLAEKWIELDREAQELRARNVRLDEENGRLRETVKWLSLTLADRAPLHEVSPDQFDLLAGDGMRSQ